AKALIRALAAEQSLLLLSPPGVGKSDAVRQAAAEAGLACRSLLGTQIAPEDVSGIPRIVGERSVFCPPRVLLPERPEPFCLFLDELPACPPVEEYLGAPSLLPGSDTARWFVIHRLRSLVKRGEFPPTDPARVDAFLAALPMEFRFALLVDLTDEWARLGASEAMFEALKE